MQVNVEVLNELSRKMVVTVPAEGIEQEIEKRIKELAPRAKVAGFREGRVPIAMVRQQFAPSVRNEVLSEVLQKTYREALEKEKLSPAGLPAMRFINSDVGQPLEYEAVFEVYPNIATLDVKDLKIKSYRVEISDNDVEEMLVQLSKQLTAWVPVDRPAQLGDQALIDFDGYIEGETFEGSSGKQVLLELGSNAAIPGFEEGLVGSKSDSQLELQLQFPENYGRQELASKQVSIHVKVYKISEPKLPEINDEVAQKFGVKEGGLSALRAQVRRNMEQDVSHLVKNKARAQLVDAIISANPIEVPNTLVEMEVGKLQQQVEAQLKQSGQAVPEQVQPKQQLVDMAKQRVILGLLFREYVKTHDLKVDRARVQLMIEQLAAPYQDPPKVVAWYKSNKEQMASIENMVLEEQVIEALMKEAVVEETVIHYTEFVAR